MKRRVASILLSMAMVATMVPANLVMAAPDNGEAAVQSTESEDEGSQEENLGMNVATRAKASASYTNKYSIDPAAMNDGKLATAEASTSWNSWGEAMQIIRLLQSLPGTASIRLPECVLSGGQTMQPPMQITMLHGQRPVK